MKIILLSFLAISVSAFTYGQIQYGVKAGYSRVDLTYSGAATRNDMIPKSDFNAGVFANIPLFNDFYLQPELMYSGQGNGFKDSATFNCNYINAPVLFKYQHAIGLFVETGPQLGFLLSAKIKTPGRSFDITNQIQHTDFSWVFGVGYENPDTNLGIDIRYNLGLSNTATGGNTLGGETGILKNTVFQIDLFYQFDLQ